VSVELFWWLRLPGISAIQVSIVDRYGNFDYKGIVANDAQNNIGNGFSELHSRGVRPAIWLNL